MTTTTETFGDRVRRARVAVGMTQTDLANAVGMTQPGILKLEKSAQRSSKLLLKFAAALDQTPQWLENGGAGFNTAPHADHKARIAHEVRMKNFDTTGLPETPAEFKMRTVPITGTVQAGVFRKDIALPHGQREYARFSVRLMYENVEVVGMTVEGRHGRYPSGSVLALVPVDAISPPLQDGDMVVCSRTNAKGDVERAPYEYVDAGGRKSLRQESEAATVFQLPLRGQSKEITIESVVISHTTPSRGR